MEVPGDGPALDFFSQCLRQHVLVEREIRHEPFQPAVLLFHLQQSPQFAHVEMRAFLLPGIKRLLGNPELMTDIANAGTRLGLTEGIDDLFFEEL